MTISELFKSHKAALGIDRTLELLEVVDQEFAGVEVKGNRSNRERIETKNRNLVAVVARHCDCSRRIYTFKNENSKMWFFPKGFTSRLHQALLSDLKDRCPDVVLAMDLGL